MRVLIPMNLSQCENYVVGVRENSLTALLDEAADAVLRFLRGPRPEIRTEGTETADTEPEDGDSAP